MATFDETMSDPNLKFSGSSSGSGNSAVTSNALGQVGNVALAIGERLGQRKVQRVGQEFLGEARAIAAEELPTYSPVFSAQPTNQELSSIASNQQGMAEFERQISRISSARTMARKEKILRLGQLRDQALSENYFMADGIERLYARALGYEQEYAQATETALSPIDQAMITAQKNAQEVGLTTSQYLLQQRGKALENIWMSLPEGQQVQAVADVLEGQTIDFIEAMNGSMKQSGELRDLSSVLIDFEKITSLSNPESSASRMLKQLETQPQRQALARTKLINTIAEQRSKIESHHALIQKHPAEAVAYFQASIENGELTATKKHLPEFARLLSGKDDKLEAITWMATKIFGPNWNMPGHKYSEDSMYGTFNKAIDNIQKHIDALESSGGAMFAVPQNVESKLEDLILARTVVEQEYNAALNRAQREVMRYPDLSAEDKAELQAKLLNEEYLNLRDDVKQGVAKIFQDLGLMDSTAAYELSTSSNPQYLTAEDRSDIRTGQVKNEQLAQAAVNVVDMRTASNDPKFRDYVERRIQRSVEILSKRFGASLEDLEIVRTDRPEGLSANRRMRVTPPGGWVALRFKPSESRPFVPPEGLKGRELRVAAAEYRREQKSGLRPEALDPAARSAMRHLSSDLNAALFWHEDLDSVLGDSFDGLQEIDERRELAPENIERLKELVAEYEETEERDKKLVGADAGVMSLRASDRLTLLNRYRDQLSEVNFEDLE